MKHRLAILFKKYAYEPEKGLPERIWGAILARESRALFAKRFGFLFVAGLSLLGLVPAFAGLARELALSGTGAYFSLLFSGGGVLASSGKELLLSLTESLPIASIALCVALALLLLWSLRVAIRNGRASRARFA